jgi:membrane peptidoglycan carboxypeptidase
MNRPLHRRRRTGILVAMGFPRILAFLRPLLLEERNAREALSGGSPVTEPKNQSKRSSTPRPALRLIRLSPDGRIHAAVPEILGGPAEFRRELGRRVPRQVWITLLIGGGFLALMGYELRTSALQSVLLSRYADRLTYQVGRGPSVRIVFPTAGPFDQRLGYIRIPEFVDRLEKEGYRVARQARFSESLDRLARKGVTPPYAIPAGAGLRVRGMGGSVLYDARAGNPEFERYEEIPPLLVRTLLFIENRKLESPPDRRSNPVVDWGRLLKASALYAGRRIGLPLRIEGGSTLATQLAKYQHSPEGRTMTPSDKLKQMLGASLDAYREGPDTEGIRRQIILDYFNNVPLGAAPGAGELNGLSGGLRAWFGTDFGVVCRALESTDEDPDAKAVLYKQSLALLCAARAPSRYLSRDRIGLESRIALYVDALEKEGVLAAGFAGHVRTAPLVFADTHTVASPVPGSRAKAVNLVRRELAAALGVPSYYDLDRLDLEAEASIDVPLQEDVTRLFRRLRDPSFLEARGLKADRHLLAQGNPDSLTYSLLLFEKTPIGNLVRVQTDTRDGPFDVNSMMKMELGSTAKLRTAVHYLEIVTELHREFTGLTTEQLDSRAETARDPITRWAALAMRDEHVSLARLLDMALDRTYPAGTGEYFFTGGGLQQFGNFESDEDGRVFSVREALIHSVNLSFVRLMRDLVAYHRARLPYDTDRVLEHPDDPDRARLLHEIAQDEGRSRLYAAWKQEHGLSREEIVSGLLGSKAGTARAAAVLYYAWRPEIDLDGWLRAWTKGSGQSSGGDDASRMEKAYGNPRLTLADYAWLLGVHPLDLWCAGELFRKPDLAWNEVYASSASARRVSSEWLFKTRNRGAQDLRLRIRFERDAFARMTPGWQRDGFPFARLVPSLATAIGGSGDRPSALAELIGIIMNDGVRYPVVTVPRLFFARGTPYETVMASVPAPGDRVFPAEIARALRPALEGVVERGTARRLAKAISAPDGSHLAVGGKTGSGDNRYKSFGPGGRLISSEAVSRTAAFVFYVGDRYFGVVTASIEGPSAGGYRFTSALPTEILKILSPAIEARMEDQSAAAVPVAICPAPARSRFGVPV